MIHISRHLHKLHGWSKGNARTALVRYGMRKAYSFSNLVKTPKSKATVNTEDPDKKSREKNKKDYHQPRFCPVEGCKSLNRRFSPHLRKVHKLGPDEVKEYLTTARQRYSKSSSKSPPRKRRITQAVVERDKPKQPSEMGSSSKLTESIENSTDDCDGDETEDINKQEVFTNFKRWLQSADGGQLDHRTAKQQYKQMIKLFGLVDGKKDLKSLYNPGLINEKFLESHATKAYNPNITQSYLMSLRRFYVFSLPEERGKLIPFPNESVFSLKENIRRWSSSFRQTTAKRHWEKNGGRSPSTNRPCTN
ncbi:hypothetical protein P5673_026658 [Acropora cervicornis]|uniref:Core-binding (CB) domain-containing protein n=1 Tax=Acropora cervicornis TaxID=6130 RepID=A0AAD9Q0Y5_ACRCE|nr:hypothetical protein P5673_026658 [Acropora cervicornis]